MPPCMFLPPLGTIKNHQLYAGGFSALCTGLHCGFSSTGQMCNSGEINLIYLAYLIYRFCFPLSVLILYFFDKFKIKVPSHFVERTPTHWHPFSV